MCADVYQSPELIHSILCCAADMGGCGAGEGARREQTHTRTHTHTPLLPPNPALLLVQVSSRKHRVRFGIEQSTPDQTNDQCLVKVGGSFAQSPLCFSLPSLSFFAPTTPIASFWATDVSRHPLPPHHVPLFSYSNCSCGVGAPLRAVPTSSQARLCVGPRLILLGVSTARQRKAATNFSASISSPPCRETFLCLCLCLTSRCQIMMGFGACTPFRWWPLSWAMH
jgi:hypothetical protein